MTRSIADALFMIQTSNNETSKDASEPNKKRKYTSKLRKKAKKALTVKEEILLSEESINKILTHKCGGNCLHEFSRSDIVDIRNEYANMGTEKKKLEFVVSSIKLNPPDSFYINDTYLCGKCFQVVHGISLHKMRKAKYIIKHHSIIPEHGNKGKEYVVDLEAELIIWLKRLKEEYAEPMPNSNEWHLPAFQKWKDIYFLYEAEKIDKCYSFLTFMKKRVKHFPELKLPKRTRLGKCTTCAAITAERLKVKSPQEKQKLKEKMEKHAAEFRGERLMYHNNRELAHKEPEKYLSVIIDGAQATPYPVLCPVLKDRNSANSLNIGNYGLISHHRERQIKLVLPNFKGGSNMSISVLHDYFSSLKAKNKLPPYILIQGDNCAKELKNKYAFGYFGLLIALKWVQEIQIGTMIVGHTHCDVDQMFSTYSQYFNNQNSIPSPIHFMDMIDKIYVKESTRPQVSWMTQQFDWKGMFRTEVNHFENISQYHGFKFTCQNGIPKFQVRKLNYLNGPWIGPEEKVDTFFDIFNDFEEMDIERIPNLVTIVPFDKKTLSGIDTLQGLDETTTNWYKELAKHGGLNITTSVIPEDFWMLNSTVEEDTQTNDSQDQEEELQPKEKQLNIRAPSIPLFQYYEDGMSFSALDMIAYQIKKGQIEVAGFIGFNRDGDMIVEEYVSEGKKTAKYSREPNVFHAVDPKNILIVKFELNDNGSLDSRVEKELKKCLSKTSKNISKKSKKSKK